MLLGMKVNLSLSTRVEVLYGSLMCCRLCSESQYESHPPRLVRDDKSEVVGPRTGRQFSSPDGGLVARAAEAGRQHGRR